MSDYAYGSSATVEPECFKLKSATWREPWAKCHHKPWPGASRSPRDPSTSTAASAATPADTPRAQSPVNREALKPKGHARVSGAGPLASRAAGPARSADRHRSRACRRSAPPLPQKGSNPCRSVLQSPP